MFDKKWLPIPRPLLPTISCSPPPVFRDTGAAAAAAPSEEPSSWLPTGPEPGNWLRVSIHSICLFGSPKIMGGFTATRHICHHSIGRTVLNTCISIFQFCILDKIDIHIELIIFPGYLTSVFFKILPNGIPCSILLHCLSKSLSETEEDHPSRSDVLLQPGPRYPPHIIEEPHLFSPSEFLQGGDV